LQVTALIASIVTLGAAFVIPAVTTSPLAFALDHAATMALTAMVLFNYFACEQHGSAAWFGAVVFICLYGEQP